MYKETLWIWLHYFWLLNCQNNKLDSLSAKWTFTWEWKIFLLPQQMCHKCKTSSWSQRKEGDRQNLSKFSLFSTRYQGGWKLLIRATVMDPKYTLSSMIFPAFTFSYQLSLSPAYITQTPTFPHTSSPLRGQTQRNYLCFLCQTRNRSRLTQLKYPHFSAALHLVTSHSDSQFSCSEFCPRFTIVLDYEILCM